MTTLTAWFDQAIQEQTRSSQTVPDDPLGVVRGIAFSALASILVFWLPLAYMLSR